ncbi:MAG: Wzz/FepE/Etk N-terminal domain-containing protein [Lachnospiraceae bacterium]|nr:Wzz/FepE/Etk N-terminal domain-containing protein [Lachnospiraceae bacterium]
METKVKNQFEQDETTIDLLDLFGFLWKWAWLIVTVALLAGSTAYVGTKMLVTPTYKTAFTAYVNNRNAGAGADISSILSSSDMLASQSLANSYAEIIRSRDLLLEAAAEAGEDEYEYEELLKAVSTDVLSNTEIITVSVELEDPNAAVAIANSLADISGEHIADIVDGSSMKIIDRAILPETYYTPNYLKNTMLGGMLGVVLVCGFLILLYFMDDTIKSEKDLAERLDVTIVGSIPDLASADRGGYGYGYGYGYAYAKKAGGQDRK